MTVEERLRATTEAVTEAMRPVRPLNLRPDVAAARAPGKRRLLRPPRRWPGWLIPLAAAMAVIVVAATLVTVRSLSAAGLRSRPTPATTSVPVNGAPRYYVADSAIDNGSEDTVFVGDTHTGKRLATFKPPSNVTFGVIAAAADDRTFVVEAEKRPTPGPPWHLGWYVLRLTPGATQLARLTRIPVASSFTTAAVSGLAVSPDGRAFAVVFRAAGGGRSTVTSADPVTLQIYSVATGQLLRTWTAPLSQRDLYAFGDLSWLDDGHTLAFAYPADSADRDVRTLNTTSPGTNLIAGSRAVFSAPTGHTCDSSLLMTADGKSVICGVFAPNNGWCTTGQLALTAYSVATGKLERVLYRYQGRCSFGAAIVVWAKSAKLAIGLITVSKSVPPQSPGPLTVMSGVATPGKFTSLPVTLMRGIGYEAPGLIAF